MKEWEIWIEGYSATGEHADASFIGKSFGETFDEACLNFEQSEDMFTEWGDIITDPTTGRLKQMPKKIHSKGDKLVLDTNSDGSLRRGSYRGNLPPGKEREEAIKRGGNYSIWACQLFDNETDARKSFG